ncbi:IclR family transcriptional regulator [Paenibacillus sp. TRM 82003]|nr:IclR family transcriptional regulator [Paenibacillus sp. TRM 82003]
MADVLEKAVKILQVLRPRGEELELSATEISRKLELPVQSVHRLLHSLRQHGFVQKNPETKKYKLGFAFLEYGFQLWNNLQFRAAARPFIETLAGKLQESVYLTMRDEDEGVFVDAIDSPLVLRVSEPIGQRLPLAVGASNRVVMAYLPERARQSILARTDWSRLPSVKPLTYERVFEELAEIRARGYAVAVGETTEGAICIAAPIFSFDGVVVGGVSVAGPELRFGPQRVEETAFLAKRTAQRISEEMGWRGRGRSVPG